MSTILVTGGAGFIGSHVVDLLIDQEHSVVVLDNLRSGLKENINSKAEFVLGDIRDKNLLEDVFNKYKIDYIIHEAAIINTNILQEDPNEDLGVSVLGTLNLIDCCYKYNIKRFVFASSVAVYGAPDEKYLPVNEKSHFKPVYSYGIAKLCAEDYIRYYAESRGLSFGILRYVNIYGPRQPIYGEVGVIAIFSSLVAKNQELTVFGDGTQQRDFLYVEDAARATVKALFVDQNITLNIGSGKGTTVNEVVSAFKQIVDTEIVVNQKELRVGEIGRFYCSNELAIKKLDWEPNVPLTEGLKSTLEFERTKKI